MATGPSFPQLADAAARPERARVERPFAASGVAGRRFQSPASMTSPARHGRLLVLRPTATRCPGLSLPGACRSALGRYVGEMRTINLGKADGLPPVDWAAVVAKLDAGSAPAPDAANTRTTWLCTINGDGSPHVTAVGAIWVDGTFWFQTGAGTRKSGNVARDPRCSVAISILDA